MIGFHTFKAILALIGADWGCQTGHQAALKNQRWQQRAAHVGIVAGLQGISALTADVSWNSGAAFILLNAIAGWAISPRLPRAGWGRYNVSWNSAVVGI